MIRNRCIRNAYVAFNLMIYGFFGWRKPLEIVASALRLSLGLASHSRALGLEETCSNCEPEIERKSLSFEQHLPSEKRSSFPSKHSSYRAPRRAGGLDEIYFNFLFRLFIFTFGKVTRECDANGGRMKDARRT